MREYQEKKKRRKALYSRPVLFLLLVLIVFFSRATYKVYKKERESAANAIQAQISLERLENRQKILTHELEKLKTNEGVEEEIRGKFGVSKPGEEVLIIVDDRDATTTPVIEEKDFWQRLKDIFKRPF